MTTIFTIYDYVKNIVGDSDKYDIKMLIKSGVDMHSFNPSASDLKSIVDCDLFIYVGGESDEWVEKALKSDAKNVKTLNLIKKLPDMVLFEDEEAEDEEGVHEVGNEIDEHIWLSLFNASDIVSIIKEAMFDVASDDAEKERLEENTDAYSVKIDELENEYSKAFNNNKEKVMVFADRFPFKYLCEDYDILYFAAFKGCSAESEASFEKITNLAKKVDEYNLNHVFTLEGNNHKIAKTVIENTKDKNATILELDSMQSVTEKNVQDGANYLDIMKKNLEVLKQAFK